MGVMCYGTGRSKYSIRTAGDVPLLLAPPFPPRRRDVSALTGNDRFCNRNAAVKPLLNFELRLANPKAAVHSGWRDRRPMPLSEPPPAAQDLQRGGGFRVSAGSRRSLLLLPADQAEPRRWSDPVRLRTLSCSEPEPAGQGLIGAVSLQLFIAADLIDLAAEAPSSGPDES
jgi:hypothetical protein